MMTYSMDQREDLSIHIPGWNRAAPLVPSPTRSSTSMSFWTCRWNRCPFEIFAGNSVSQQGVEPVIDRAWHCPTTNLANFNSWIFPSFVHFFTSISFGRFLTELLFRHRLPVVLQMRSVSCSCRYADVHPRTRFSL